MRDGHLEASGHNWVEGQGSGARIDKKAGEEEDTYDAMGNKIEATKVKKLTSAEARKVCVTGSVYRRVVTNCSRSSRRSVWHGRRGVRRSPTTSCKGLIRSCVFFCTPFTLLLCHLCISHHLFVSFTDRRPCCLSTRIMLVRWSSCTIVISSPITVLHATYFHEHDYDCLYSQ